MLMRDLPMAGLLSPNSLAFATYWSSLPKTGLIPDRDSFDPAAVKKFLNTFVILELVSPTQITFRLAGTAEAARYGRDVTGLNYLDYVEAKRRPKASEAFHAIVSQPCGMLAVIHSLSASGTHSTNEAIGFPMRDPLHHASIIYFQSNTLPENPLHDSYVDPLSVHSSVSRRIFIDIGAGTPDFSD